MPVEVDCLRSRDLAAHWFLESGIQEPFGGVARYYRSDVGRNHRVSTEITGYAASTLVWLHGLTGNNRLLEAALRAGRFLARRAFDPAAGVFPFEYALDGDCAEPLAYFFDNAIVVRGLLALWRASGEREFLETAGRCAAGMSEIFRAAAGFHPVVRLPEGQPAPADARWSRNPGCYHLKAALAWRELEQIGGQAAYEPDCRLALEFALATHREFLPERLEPSTMDRLHAYCYFLEGLLACTERPECRQALREGIERAARLLEAMTPIFERSDVRAQLLRVRLFADALGVLPLDPAEGERQAAGILRFQLLDPDPRLYGGFCFGRKGSDWLPYVNPYSTAFATQALEMWRAHRFRRFQPAWQDLI